MKYANNPERQRVLKQALDATTLPELEAATLTLDAWVAAHPDDIGIQDAYEQMALMELAAQETSTSRTNFLNLSPLGKQREGQIAPPFYVACILPVFPVV